MKLFKRKKKETAENTYIPAMGVNDAKRKQFFTTYNIELMNEIRRIKLNDLILN